MTHTHRPHQEICLLLVLLLSLCTLKESLSQSICNTGSNDESIGPLPGTAEASSSSIYLKLYVHSIDKENGNERPTTENIRESIAIVRKYFAEQGIYFVWDCYIDPVTSTSLYNETDVECDIDAYATETDGINLFIGPDNAPRVGFATGIPSGYVLVKGTNDCEFLDDSEYILSRSTIIAHEMGHALGLWHTHHEVVDDRQGIVFIKMDTTGTLLDYSVYYDSLDANYSLFMGGLPKGFLRSSDGSGYVLVGHVFQRGNGIVMKIGNNGKQLWVAEYPDPLSRTEVYAKIVDVGNGYLISGRKQGLNYKSDIFVMKIDLEGNRLWEKKYGEENDNGDYLGDLMVLNSNEVVISGTTNPGDVPIEEKRFINRIFAIGSTGLLKWQWESDPTLDETVRGLIRDNNGNWNYTTIFVDYITDTQFRGMPKFVRRDSAFNLLLENELDDAVNNYLLNMIPISDGGYLGVGVNYEIGEPRGHAYAWMIKLDENGEVLWERKDLTFPNTEISTAQYLNSAVELPGGNIIASGYYNITTDPKEYGILIKVNKDGCIDTLCTTTSLLEQILHDTEIRVYPNPAVDHMIFDVPANVRETFAEIFDFTGRTVLKVPVTSGSNTINLNRYGVGGGIHAWRVSDVHDRLLGSGKILIIQD